MPGRNLTLSRSDRGSPFDCVTRIHHIDALARRRDKADIVADEQQGHVSPTRSSSSNDKISAWVVTSGAVVGSSADH